jgi:hypothetical protein
MTIESTASVTVSAAGVPIAQAAGTDLDAARLAASAAQLKHDADQRAARAAGIAQADGDDLQAGERDSDGRSAWILRRRTMDPTSEPFAERRDSDGPGRILDVTG